MLLAALSRLSRAMHYTAEIHARFVSAQRLATPSAPSALPVQPTSGLDSYTSNEVMTVVRSLIKDGTTIIATIHSPSAYTFRWVGEVPAGDRVRARQRICPSNCRSPLPRPSSPHCFPHSLFDRLMMLVRGEVVYFGANGKPALEYVQGNCPMLKDKDAGYNDAGA